MERRAIGRRGRRGRTMKDKQGTPRRRRPPEKRQRASERERGRGVALRCVVRAAADGRARARAADVKATCSGMGTNPDSLCRHRSRRRSGGREGEGRRESDRGGGEADGRTDGGRGRGGNQIFRTRQKIVSAL